MVWMSSRGDEAGWAMLVDLASNLGQRMTGIVLANHSDLTSTSTDSREPHCLLMFNQQ